MGVLRPIRLGGWIRAVVGDVERAFKLVPGLKHLSLSISTSNQMIRGKFHAAKSQDDVLSMMADAVEAARAHGARSIGVDAEDASRTDTDLLIRYASVAKKHGADRFRYCDTLGYDNPFTIYQSARALADDVGMPVELHCHGGLGMAMANSLAGAKGVIDGGQDATSIRQSMELEKERATLILSPQF